MAAGRVKCPCPFTESGSETGGLNREVRMLPIILGSSSSGRQRILREAGFLFECRTPQIDEKAIRDPDPSRLVLRLSHAKADALLPGIHQPALLITADQVVLCDGELREKPANADECRRFLASYSAGIPAETVTAVVVTATASNRRFEGVDIARQYFGQISGAVVEKAIQAGRILSCAGGFQIDDPLFQPYLLRREGDEDSIIGLPMNLVRRLLSEAEWGNGSAYMPS